MREPEGTHGHEVKNLLSLEEIEEWLHHLPLKTWAKEHQARCLFLAIGHPQWFFALDMGLGKTKLSLDIITTNKWLAGKTKALVTCYPIVLRQWKKEIQKHSELSSVVVEGNDKFQQLKKSDADITVVSHSWLVTLFSRAEKDPELAKKLKEVFAEYDILIVDEAHALKNPQTKGFKGYCKFLLHIPKRYLMTGTPVGNDWTGIWSQYFILDKGKTFGRSFRSFLNEYFDSFYNGRYTKYTIKAAQRKKLIRNFWAKTIRWQESECNDLPDKTYTTIPVGMSKHQQKKYEEILNDEKLSEFELMKTTAGIYTEESPKLEAVNVLVNELCIENKKQFIIWCWLQEENDYIVKNLTKKFPKLKIKAVNGKTGEKAKDRILEEWGQGKVNVLVANQKSLGIGIDLVETNTCCFFSNNLSFIDRKQSEKRIHRTGQKHHCHYIDLVCERTIDEINLAILNKAGDGFSELTKDYDVKKMVRAQRL